MADSGNTGLTSDWFFHHAVTRAIQRNPALARRILEVGSRHQKSLLSHAQRHASVLTEPLLGEDGRPLVGDPWERKERASANLAAMRILSKIRWAADFPTLPYADAHEAEAMDIAALGPSDRAALRRYSGWGGVGINRYLPQFPPGFPVPEAAGLIHEYYTPSFVAEAIGRAVAPLLDGLKGEDGRVHALEPSAGVGRMVDGLSAAGGAVDWTLVEFSKVSGRLLHARFPEADVHNMPFERWVAYNGRKMAGHLGLVLSNPPYGPRGATQAEDPDSSYATHRAYLYFLRRALDLLKPGGLGVFLVPAGWLTGKGREMRKAREAVLRRHHLSTAYRLPSISKSSNEPIFPGAELVVDILFFRARKGELAEPDPADTSILSGDYFKQYPSHLLGVEEGKDDGTDIAGPEEPKKPKRRWGYQVVGDWKGLPPLVERKMCDDCVVREGTAQKRLKIRGGIARVIEEVRDLPADLADAVRLGLRVDDFLGKVATGAEGAAASWPELVRDLKAWVERHGNPSEREALRELAVGRRLVGAQRFLSAFTMDGQLTSAIVEKPVIQRRYVGAADLMAEADWLYRQEQGLNISRLLAFHAANGGNPVGAEEALDRLLTSGWFLDGEKWDRLLPERDYLTGDLWPRYDHAKTRAERTEDAQARRQMDALMRAIKPAKWQDLVDDVSPRESWLPTDLVASWLAVSLAAGYDTPVLTRERGLLRLEGVDYDGLSGRKKDKGRMEGVASPQTIWFIGWANHDNELFRPPILEYYDDGEAKKETIDQARLRVAQGGDFRGEDGKWRATATGETENGNWVDNFRGWLRSATAWHPILEEAYNRQLRGFIPPTFSDEPIHIARWNPEAPQLYPYQSRGLRRLRENRSGMLAYDVGMGKTYTGIATVALARQEGWAQRPVILVPNSIIWKWYRDFQRVLPDYRVAVVGSKRSIAARGSKRGRLRAEPDTPDERAEKWTAFQAGQFDVVLLTYSALGRTRMDPEQLKKYAEETSAIRRLVELSKGGDDDRWSIVGERGIFFVEVKGKEKDKKERFGPYYTKPAAEAAAREKMEKRRTERQEAVGEARVSGWLATMLATPKDWVYDPGIDWHQLGVDFLMVDEAQNFKGLFGPEEREGGIPDSMGTSEPSKRAWQLDFRCASVRERTGGSGVFLLSATPAKNGPVEFYNMIHLIGPKAWQQVGISNPESFIDRYCEFTVQHVLKANGQLLPKQACTAFKNLDEIRGVIFRHGEFLTPERVGLKVPDAIVRQHYVQLSEEQNARITSAFNEAQDLMDRMKHVKDEGVKEGMRMKIQSIAMRAYAIGVHPYLPDINPRYDEEGNETYAGINPDSVNPHSPKIDAVVHTILNMASTYEYGSINLLNRTVPQSCDTDGFCLNCGHIIFAENVATHGWIKRCLVEAGIAEDRIAILNATSASDPETRQQIAMDFNGNGRPGDDDFYLPLYDIVIANAVAYEGVDLQKRTCAIHHVDVPWEPATLQQRNGRGVRQGNTFEAVEIHYYFSEGGADLVRVGKIQNKRSWMTSLLESQDRQTNNLAAGIKMSPAELLASMAPPKARAKFEEKIAEEKEREEQLRKGRIRSSANKLLEKVDGRFRAAEETTDLAEAQRLREEAEKYLLDMAKFDAQVWPWYGRALQVRHQAVLVPGGMLPPLVVGQKIQYEAGKHLEIGRWQWVQDANRSTVLMVGVREENGAWEKINIEKLASRLKNLGEADLDPPTWRDEKTGDMQRTLETRVSSQLRWAGQWQTDISWRWASPSWQAAWWPVIGQLLERHYSRNALPSDAAFPMVDGDQLFLWTPQEDAPPNAAWLAPTEIGWRQFLKLAPSFDPAGERRFSRLKQAGLWWWGRQIPQDLLREGAK